jgi:hypothetical protein
MKSKLTILAVILVCLSGSKVKADTVITISGTGETPPPFDLEAQLTLEPVFGTYFNPGPAFDVTTTENLVVAMTGTFNGAPVTLTNPLSWFGLDLSLDDVDFSAAGVQYAMFPDIGDTLFGPGGGLMNLTINSITNTPEPTSLVLLLVGLGGLAWRRLKS